MTTKQITPSKHAHTPLSKRTKILATVGPATNSYEAVNELIREGVNGFRFNFSHGTHEEKEQQIKWVRKAAKAHSKPVAVVQDLQGPKIRLGDFEGAIVVEKGQSISFAYKSDYVETGHLPTQYDLSKKMKKGERLLLCDGKVNTTVTSVRGVIVHVAVNNDGILSKRKGINLPDTDFGGDVITPKDESDIACGVRAGVDYIALSFVQSATDVESLRNILKKSAWQPKIIAKIETAAALEDMEEIVRSADAVMIARGDLAIETLHEMVPIMQRKIIGLGQKYGRPTIVATQMLASMTDVPEPTRAEASDVATAVVTGADCVMLSDETASGHYPIEAVRAMKRIITYTQKNLPYTVNFPENDEFSHQSAIAKAIIGLADSIDARAIVAETKSGATALNVAMHRPLRTIIVVASEQHIAQQLAIVYGTKTFVRPEHKEATTKLIDWLKKDGLLKKDQVVVTASGQQPGVIGTTDTIKVRVV